MFKKIIVVAVLLSLVQLCPAVYAEVSEKNVRVFGTPISPLTVLDEYYPNRSAIEAGAGLDLILFKFSEEAKYLSKVKLELRKDFVDFERFSSYLVVQVDVSSIFDFLK